MRKKKKGSLQKYISRHLYFFSHHPLQHWVDYILLWKHCLKGVTMIKPETKSNSYVVKCWFWRFNITLITPFDDLKNIICRICKRMLKKIILGNEICSYKWHTFEHHRHWFVKVQQAEKKDKNLPPACKLR